MDLLEVNDLQVSIDSMLSVLKHVNDVMHTDAIIGFKVRITGPKISLAIYSTGNPI